MQVVLENINSEPKIPESAEPEAVEVVDAPPEPQEPAIAESPAAPEQRDEVHKVDLDDENVVDCSTREPAAAPAPKKRGRPPKAKAEAPPPALKVRAAPKPKAVRKPKPPVEESSDSSDVDNTLRNVYNHVAKPDMETAILQFLVNRKQAESTRRRELWGRLAQM